MPADELSREIVMDQMTEDKRMIDGGAEKAAADMSDGRGEGRGGRGRRRRKVSYLTINKIDYVDYKDVAVLRRFLTDRGKILSSRQTGNTAKQQRMIATSIKKAREMALLPFVVTEVVEDRGEGRRPRREQ